VRMVSEGVDVPRLAVGVYATSSSTPLFFAQAIGRFVRARRRGETASIFIPSVPPIMGLANELERERDHALDREGSGDELLADDLLREAETGESASDALTETYSFAALESQAQFDKVLYEGVEFGQQAEVGSLEELDFLGLPGILEPDQVHELLRSRYQRQMRRVAERPPSERQPAPLYRTLKEQRTLLNSLVGLRAKLTGQPHGHVHAELRRVCGGPAVGQASVAQLQSRIDFLRRQMAAGGS